MTAHAYRSNQSDSAGPSIGHRPVRLLDSTGLTTLAEPDWLSANFGCQNYQHFQNSKHGHLPPSQTPRALLRLIILSSGHLCVNTVTTTIYIHHYLESRSQPETSLSSTIIKTYRHVLFCSKPTFSLHARPNSLFFLSRHMRHFIKIEKKSTRGHPKTCHT